MNIMVVNLDPLRPTQDDNSGDYHDDDVEWMKMTMVNPKTPSGPLKMIIVVVVDRGGDEYNGDDDDNDEYNGGQLKDPSGLLKSSRHQTQSYSSPQMIELIDCTIGEKKKEEK